MENENIKYLSKLSCVAYKKTFATMKANERVRKQIFEIIKNQLKSIT